jgi:hypothetical protein
MFQLMKNLFSFVGPRRITVLLIFLATTYVQAESVSVITVKVRPGDTISYLALKHLHTYDQDILDQIKELNPQIRDLNRIQVGQAVLLPKPGEEPAQPIAPAPLVESKKMAAAASRAVATLVEGEVQVMAGGDNTWLKLSPNAILKGGDKVRVLDNGRLEMVLDNRSVLRLASNTTLELKEVERKPEKETYRFALSLGKMDTSYSTAGLWLQISSGYPHCHYRCARNSVRSTSRSQPTNAGSRSFRQCPGLQPIHWRSSTGREGPKVAGAYSRPWSNQDIP